MEVSGHHHTPAALSPEKNARTHLKGDWLGPRVGLGDSEKKKSPLSLLRFEARTMQSLYRICHPGSKFIKE